jgi:signal transduction histidine kinase
MRSWMWARQRVGVTAGGGAMAAAPPQTPDRGSTPARAVGGSLRAVAPAVTGFLRNRPFEAAETGEHPLTSIVRLLLVATALVLTFVAPHDSSGTPAVTYWVLGAYTAHAAAVMMMRRLRNSVPTALQVSRPWTDVVVFGALVWLNGWSSIYTVMLFFGLFVAALRWVAFNTATTVTAIIVLMALGYVSHSQGTVLDVDHAVISAVILGYVTVFRAEHQRRTRARLRLLRDMATLSNARFGTDRMSARSLESLREFYDAALCVAILPAGEPGAYELRRATRGNPEAAREAEKVSAPFASKLLSLGSELAYVRPGFRGALAVSSAGRPPPGAQTNPPDYETIAELLGVASYLTVPLRDGASSLGRLYIADHAAPLAAGEMEFLLQTADRIMPILAHITRVERMAARTADDERRRISLDIHDRLIQPYIGLQMGIDAVRQVVARYPAPAVPAVVHARVAALAELSDAGVQDLRAYITALRSAPASDGLLESLRRFSQHFQDATGLTVTLDADSDLRVDSRLALELVSMASEAVSNVHRHTNAPRVRIALRSNRQRVVLRVENPVSEDAPVAPFVPRSIAERARALGGDVNVAVTSESTAVVVEIPL